MKEYKEQFVHPQDQLVVIDYDVELDASGEETFHEKEYDVNALLKVIAEMRDVLLFECGVSADKVQSLFEQSGVSERVYSEFDISQD